MGRVVVRAGVGPHFLDSCALLRRCGFGLGFRAGIRAAAETNARGLATSFQSNPARQVKLDRDVFGVSGEIGIGRENLQAVPGRDGADQQVRPGTLQAPLAEAIIRIFL